MVEAIRDREKRVLEESSRERENHIFDPPRLFDQLMAQLENERRQSTHSDSLFPGRPDPSEQVHSHTYPGPPWKNPTQLELPAYLMNFPFSYATDFPGNLWMQDQSKEDRKPDHRRVAAQFLDLYRSLASEAVVYLIPSPPDVCVQDLVFTANLGIVLCHLPDQNTVLVSNFSSPPRKPETRLGEKFFKSMGYDVYLPPARFEGEAELLHLHDNIYAGGYGIRSEWAAYDWMERNFDMRIVRIREVEPYLYTLDCMVFPITLEDTLVCTDLIARDELAELEKVTNIIPVSLDQAILGICNSVRHFNRVLNASDIRELKAGTEDYRAESDKNQRLEDIAGKLNLEVSYFNLNEFQKSGSWLSRLVMHLNRINSC